MARLINWNSLLLTILTILAAFITVLLLRIDLLVNVRLYDFGLKFDPAWANEYWSLLRLAIFVVWLMLLVGIIATIRQRLLRIRLQTKQIAPRKFTLTEFLRWLFLAIGGITLIFSFLYSSNILTLTGLGLIFWAALFFYIAPAPYVKSELLTSTLSSSSSINRMLEEAKIKGEGIYLPPKYLKNPESSLVFITSKKDTSLSDLKEVDEKQHYKNSEGLFLIPPGHSLCQLFEKKLETTFTRVDLNFFQENFPKLFIEDLEIAEDADIQVEGNIVNVELVDNVFSDVCQRTGDFKELHKFVGCPLCSAIACAIAKTTGKPVTIEKEQQEGRTTKIQYRLLPEEV